MVSNTDEPARQIAVLRDNYERGAIDVVTFLNAMDDIWDSVPNSYGQATYDINADGGEPQWPGSDEQDALDKALTGLMVVLFCLGCSAFVVLGYFAL